MNHTKDWTPSYWMEVPMLRGATEKPRDHGIAVIGSGLSGVSTAYWLLEMGFKDISIIDFEPEKAATFRNCGHILYGTVESMKALNALHGPKVARDIWGYSIEICHDVRNTIQKLNIEAEYKQDGYLVIAIDEVENNEVKESIDLLRSMDFQSEYVDRKKLSEYGFKNVHGARYEPGSAQAHPMKFRNGVLKHCIDSGVKHYSDVKVSNVSEVGEHICVTSQHGKNNYDAVVIAANAYSPLFSDFFASRRLVEPFKGQIITSKPLKHEFAIKYPHSFDHGYEYAIVTADNRLMIGGWRNHTPGREMGTYDVVPNNFVEQGLQDFVQNHYEIKEKIEWEFSWAGIMAASKTGFPFIGPTNSPRIFTCAGYTGHGFSWAHGSAKLLAKIMAGENIPDVARYFRP